MLDEIAHLEGEEYRVAETVAKNCAAVLYGGELGFIILKRIGDLRCVVKTAGSDTVCIP